MHSDNDLAFIKYLCVTAMALVLTVSGCSVKVNRDDNETIEKMVAAGATPACLLAAQK